MEFLSQKVSAQQREAQTKNAILIILVNEKESVDGFQLQYKLLQCGILIAYPELVELVDGMKAEGYIEDSPLNEAESSIRRVNKDFHDTRF